MLISPKIQSIIIYNQIRSFVSIFERSRLFLLHDYTAPVHVLHNPYKRTLHDLVNFISYQQTSFHISAYLSYFTKPAQMLDSNTKMMQSKCRAALPSPIRLLWSVIHHRLVSPGHWLQAFLQKENTGPSNSISSFLRSTVTTKWTHAPLRKPCC